MVATVVKKYLRLQQYPVSHKFWQICVFQGGDTFLVLISHFSSTKLAHRYTDQLIAWLVGWFVTSVNATFLGFATLLLYG